MFGAGASGGSVCVDFSYRRRVRLRGGSGFLYDGGIADSGLVFVDTLIHSKNRPFSITASHKNFLKYLYQLSLTLHRFEVVKLTLDVQTRERNSGLFADAFGDGVPIRFDADICQEIVELSAVIDAVVAFRCFEVQKFCE